MEMNARLSWIALNLAQGVNRVLLHELLEENADITRAFEDPDLFTRLAGKCGRSRDELVEGAGAEIERAERMGATILTIDSPEYPEELRQIYDPPLALYCLGRLPPAAGGLAIVGSRAASHYGVAIARSIARDVASCGITVVSGLARGIDTAAHLGALEASGPGGEGVTVAVLGSALNCPYPRENEPLMARIAQHGCVVSEFPFDTKPLPMNFPQRNRIISGLASRGTLVVEAAERSGALITARLASDQGRDVFAVPGNVTSPSSAGANRLIQQGAKLVGCAADILGEVAAARAGNGSGSELDGEEAAVYQRLSPDSPVHVDELSSGLDMLPSRLLTTLLALELKNRVRQLPGRFFLRKM